MLDCSVLLSKGFPSDHETEYLAFTTNSQKFFHLNTLINLCIKLGEKLSLKTSEKLSLKSLYIFTMMLHQPECSHTFLSCFISSSWNHVTCSPHHESSWRLQDALVTIPTFAPLASSTFSRRILVECVFYLDVFS